MNKQETFDYVVKHLYTQGEPAMEGSSCRYRTKNGLMCAVGCIIPDTMYVEEMEGLLVGMLPEQSGFSVPEEIGLYSDMLDSLQWVHDSWHSPGDNSHSYEGIERDLMDVASNHGVVYNKPY